LRIDDMEENEKILKLKQRRRKVQFELQNENLTINDYIRLLDELDSIIKGLFKEIKNIK